MKMKGICDVADTFFLIIMSYQKSVSGKPVFYNIF